MLRQPGRSAASIEAVDGTLDSSETWLRLVAWSAVLCRILHTRVLQKCAIIGDVAYESLTLHHKYFLKGCLAL